MEIILIGGKARNGKDTFGGFMKEYYESLGKKVCIMQISKYIKHFAIDYFGWDGSEETKPRQLLQDLGTGVIREKMGKDYFFVTRLVEDMEVLDNFFDIALVTDVRLPLEYEFVKSKYPDAVKIHVERVDFENSELTDKQSKHITETALDGYSDYDYDVKNTTLDKLKEDAVRIAKEVIK